MTAEERLALVRAKIERAEKHIGDLESEIKSFYESKPYVVGTKRDQQSRRLIYHLVSVRDTPVGVAALTGDVLNNLRSALDHFGLPACVSWHWRRCSYLARLFSNC